MNSQSVERIISFIENNKSSFFLSKIDDNDKLILLLNFIKEINIESSIMVVSKDKQQSNLIDEKFTNIKILNKDDFVEKDVIPVKNIKYGKIYDNNFCHHCNITTRHYISGQTKTCQRYGVCF